jgi:hypothetical protein
MVGTVVLLHPIVPNGNARRRIQWACEMHDFPRFMTVS